MSKPGYEAFFAAARNAKQDKATVIKKKARRNSGASFPIGPVVWAVVIMSALTGTVLNLDHIENLFARIEVQFLGSASAEDKATAQKGEKSSSTEKEKSEKSAASEKSASAKEGGTSGQWTPEQLAIFNKLEERKRTLDDKEASLQKLEEELQRQKKSIDDRVVELEDLRKKISERLDEKVRVDQEKVDKLVEVFSNMKPQNAAKVFEDLNEDLAIEILGKMKKKSAAEILNLIKSDKAQRLSERFTGYKQAVK